MHNDASVPGVQMGAAVKIHSAMAMTLLAATLALGSHTVGASGAGRCFGEAVTIAGTSGKDTPESGLIGTLGEDVMSALEGDDVAFGDPQPGHETGANDLVCAGPGDDSVRAGAGGDRVRGGPGQDRLVGGLGSDYLVDHSGGDELLGGSADDIIDIAGSPNPPSIARGGHLEDRIFSNDGNPGDMVRAGPGFDVCFVDPGDLVHSCEEKHEESP
jgi:Ca2+-binding RTX toxin-like protein